MVCGVVIAKACLLCLVAPPSGMAYTMYLFMTPLVTAGILQLTSATLGVTSLTVTSRGADGAVNSMTILCMYDCTILLWQDQPCMIYMYQEQV